MPQWDGTVTPEEQANYFASYSLLEHHLDLLKDKARVQAYFRAMRENEDKDPLASDMDDVSGESDNETTYRLLEIGSAELEEIEYALERIDEGTYGVCEECDEPIGVERLEALPFTAVCIKCKRLQESESGEYY